MQIAEMPLAELLLGEVLPEGVELRECVEDGTRMLVMW